MTITIKIVKPITFISIALLCLTGCEEQDRLRLQVGKGFSAKYLCSATFASGLDSLLVKDQLIAPKMAPLPLIWDVSIDPDQQTTVVADRIFLNESLKAKAAYQGATGCTLLGSRTAEEVAQFQVTPAPAPPLPASQPWPSGSKGVSATTFGNIDYERIEAALDAAFAQPGPGPTPLNTMAVLVAYRGELIAERYALGATPHTPLIGWSMTKGVTGALIGQLQDRGLININDPAPIAAWQDTPKANITTRDILQMAAGLDVLDDYAGLDVVNMLYLNDSALDVITQRPLAEKKTFNYNTGNAVLAGHIFQETVGGTTQDSYDFYQSQLLHPIGITTGFIEYDAKGNLGAGSFGFMSPRDWLRLGQLFLQQGEWDGAQIVSSEWIRFMTTPSPLNPEYGAMMWLNTNGAIYPRAPSDAYFFFGHQQQRMMVAPSKELVVLRLGVTEDDPDEVVDDVAFTNQLLGEIADAIP